MSYIIPGSLLTTRTGSRVPSASAWCECRSEEMRTWQNVVDIVPRGVLSGTMRDTPKSSLTSSQGLWRSAPFGSNTTEGKGYFIGQENNNMCNVEVTRGTVCAALWFVVIETS